MEEKDLDLVEDEEIETEEETAEEPDEAAEVEEEESEEGENADIEDDFEYDENGDIIVPEDPDEGEEPEGEEETPKADPAPEKDQPADEVKPPERDEEKEALRRELAAYKSQTRDTLKKLGVEDEDGLKGLVKLAAEAEGVSEEEYLKKREEAQREEQARFAQQRSAFEKRMQDDLALIHAAYPETQKYKSPEEFPNFERFGRLVDAGATPVEAYIASHPDSVKESVASATKQQSLNGTKQHLKSAVPKGAKREALHMPKGKLEEWRELFPHKSDKELVALYKKTFN